MYSKVVETTNFLKETTEYRPKVAIVLGSGLGNLVDFIDEKMEIDYSDIPNFPVSTVAGHDGKLVFGKIGGIEVVAMKGRFHFYEGYEMKEVTYPMYVMKQFGIEKLIVSNAAGGSNKTYDPGTLMLITDHINAFGTNPLIGKNDDRFGPRFPDMTEAYKIYLRDLAKEVADNLGIAYKEGVYLGTTGPTYETGAEVRAFTGMGADAIGMSTVPEVTIANYLGIDVLGISCITNMATGIAEKAHSHEDVVDVAKKAGENFCNWVINIVKKIG
ncbi:MULTISPECIES: purine-nucleoside phosphorylase [Psychrilyobacter]|uniref:Purine nucleoside phosphorylase n=1 Tax=Psychrilyobacter piezotolerans TaxID=2293438 RepID=A0ABX9KK02_9FUSO|nr:MULTISPECIES: purine-nucleoside phosphorylase [Psychrilyobacter]MCS5420531.1 purine-nucleoside phosphorylase [Psychrilyobacter sp. S5]NDI76915.1 purine-nucleoside phosphorylase [Psychrilyobacter piezotolerans]RDE65192.1 purine-nucleoside phosphorylase [Psychrilyobacter sp. S5]REI42762.1 purine-nucleoside phosphorylase [Psychrilyobacter piezotolerans]